MQKKAEKSEKINKVLVFCPWEWYNLINEKTFTKVWGVPMAQSRKISTAELRRQNRNNIYRYFYDAQTPKTKQDIANDLSLSLPTVTQNLRELMDAGLIEYAGLIDSNGGRRARSMQMCADVQFAVGIELSPKHIRLAAVNLRADVIAYEKIACPFGNDVSYRQRMARALEEFLDRFSLDRGRLLGVGITLPGIIDEENGMIEVVPVFGLRKMRLSLLTELLPYPVFVENDANAGGFAEWWNHASFGTMAYLFIGKGVGGALLIDGKPYVGVQRRSAEFGHMCIASNGKVCSCGRHDCLEAYCSTARLSDDLDISVEDFFRGLHEGNERYFAVWKNYLDALSVGINNIRMMMDCPVVVGGTITPYLEEYLPDLVARLSMRSSFDDDGSYLHLGRCGDRANCVGVALRFIADFMKSI